MNKLKKFYSMLREIGYTVTTNWQQEIGTSVIENATIKGKANTINVMFQTFGDKGYVMYTESPNSTLHEDIKYLKVILD